MKKYIYILALVLLFAKGYSQADGFIPPDYKIIEKNTTDKDSPYFFDNLFERYIAADSTMTIEDKRHLYYGYSFQEEYSPYGRSDAEKELRELLKKDDADKNDLQRLIKLTDEIQEQYPFSLRIKEYRIYCFNKLENAEAAKKEYLQAGIILDAIISTGDGTTKETCFYVINTMNEYELLDVLGYSFGGRQSLQYNRYDYLTLKENSYNLEGLYFDVSRCLNSL